MRPRTLHPDDQAVVDLLHDAFRDSGLTQAGFARALGTAPSRMSTYLGVTTRPTAQFCQKARRLGSALRRARRDGLMSAPATASAVRGHLRGGDVAWAWRAILQGRDHLASMLVLGERNADAWEAAPASTGSPQWDALMAALAAHEYARAGLEPPRWTHTEPLQPPWMPEHPFLDAVRVVARTPRWLADRGIHVPARDLVTA